MIKTSLLPAALAVAGFVALAGCSSGANHPMTQSSSAASAAVPVAAATPEVSPGLIKRVQTTLKQQQLYNGRIDGVWGPQTQGAVHAYQQSHNLTANGELDTSTLASLKTASGGSEPPVPVAMAPPATTPPTAATTAAPPPAPATE